MKFFKNNWVANLVEAYHPFASAIALAGIFATKYTQPETFRAFTNLSYATTMEREGVKAEHHLKGWDDLLFLFFWFNIVTVIRHVYIKVFLRPIAQRYRMSKNLSQKFVDCGWFSLFYLVSTAIGIYIFSDDAWWYSSHDLWRGYPHPFDYASKYYYLASLAFWLQCFFSFFFEAPRKDDGAFIFHHLLTIGLMASSYHFNFFRVGAAILLEQNAADIFYYHAKSFKYAGFERTATSILVVFLAVWVYTRHYIFGWILYSVWTELPLYLNKPGWDPVSGYYYAEWLKFLFVGALGALQGLMIYWFFLILRTVYRVLQGNYSTDPTDASSDEEDEATEKNGADKPHKEAETNGKGMNGHANGKTAKLESKKAK